MGETILLGQGDRIIEVPDHKWKENLSTVPQDLEPVLHFMSREHHLVRYFVVREMPRLGEPIQPDVIARELDMPRDRIHTILDDLESNLFFLTRNSDGAVSWAYPVTTDRTPHHLTFKTGERLHAA